MLKLNLKPNKETNSIVFYALHLPILLLLLGILALGTTFSASNLLGSDDSMDSKQEDKGVLGDDDEDDNDEDSDDNSGDDDNDDDEDEDDNDEDSDDDNDSDDNDSDDDSGDDDNDDEDENKSKTETRVQNSDGTYSRVKTETEDDKTKIEIKTFDAAGRLIKEEKHEGSDEGFESETEDSLGNKLKVRVQNTEALIKREGVTGLDNFPLYVDESSQSVYVETPSGDVLLGVMPQAVLDKANADDTVDTVDEIELESSSDDAGELEFRLNAKKSQKLFGLFKLEIPSTVYYDTDDGEYLRSEQTFVNKVLDFFSF